jgi:hypothetical protein
LFLLAASGVFARAPFFVRREVRVTGDVRGKSGKISPPIYFTFHFLSVHLRKTFLFEQWHYKKE